VRYPNAVCLLAMRPDDTVLAVSRKDDHTAFGLPGGKVDPEDGNPDLDDTFKHALVREVGEECGVVLDPDRLRVVYRGLCPGGKDGIGYWTVTMLYDGDLESASTQPGEGVVKWVSWDTLNDGPFAEYNQRVRTSLTRAA
jgi:8-oxo-dGTP pyrophosphatase MutT (NUDIX family)